MKGSTNNNFLFFPFILFICVFVWCDYVWAIINPFSEIFKRNTISRNDISWHDDNLILMVWLFLQNHQDVARVALSIAENGKRIKQFTDVLATYCVDQRYTLPAELLVVKLIRLCREHSIWLRQLDLSDAFISKLSQYSWI